MGKLSLLFTACLAVTCIGNAYSAEFPPTFKFGSATAAYQVEGGWNLNGKGVNIWDTFTHSFPELIADGSNGDVACDSYHLFKEDVAALKELGMNFYRFSISWSRVLPTGFPDSLNQNGIDYYNGLIDELIANGIEPMVTMYHWDLPQNLEDLGGFQNRDLVDWFGDYARVLYQNFGDRVKVWIPFNEPSEYCNNGYGFGIWAPGVVKPGVGEYLCAHYTVLANARAYHIYHDEFAAEQGGKCGITLNCSFLYPHEGGVDEIEVEAASRAMAFMIGIYSHPIFSQSGNYPQVVIDRVGNNSAAEGEPQSRLPAFTEEEIEYVRGTSDFFGLNYYTSRYVVEADLPIDISIFKDAGVFDYPDENWPRAKSDWLYSVPEGLTDLLKWIRDQYQNPEVLITENGWSEHDDDFEDVGRTTYLKAHLNAVLDAIDDGCNVTAHTTWSLLDNFEWLEGYTERFGIYRVDFESETKDRTIKPSAELMKEIIATRIVPE